EQLLGVADAGQAERIQAADEGTRRVEVTTQPHAAETAFEAQEGLTVRGGLRLVVRAQLAFDREEGLQTVAEVFRATEAQTAGRLTAVVDSRAALQTRVVTIFL